MINIKIAVEAWLKMEALVMYHQQEVAWLGLASKVDKNIYKIWDVLVYPQYVSPVFVDDDPVEMCEWNQKLTDEQYSMKRLHGHSHVNMHVYQSPQDRETFEDFKALNSMANENRFAIAIVLNKNFEIFCAFYDAETDTEYEMNEIKIDIEISEGFTQEDFYNQTKELVRPLENKTAESEDKEEGEIKYGFEKA